MIWRFLTSTKAIVSFSITLAGLLFLLYPRVSVYPGESLDPYDPFQTPFIIKNDGYVPLLNIEYVLGIEKIENIWGGGIQTLGLSRSNSEIPKLSPNKSSTIIMNLLKFPPKSVKYAEIYVIIKYRPYLIPFTFTEIVRFKADIKTSGEYVWFQYFTK